MRHELWRFVVTRPVAPPTQAKGFVRVLSSVFPSRGAKHQRRIAIGSLTLTVIHVLF